MSLSATAAWELRADGNDNNGGAFDPLSTGTDFARQAAPQFVIDGTTVTGIVGATTTQLTVSGLTPATTWVGNQLKVTGGSMTAGTYRVVSFVGQVVTFDRSLGTAAQTCIGNIGGGRKTLASVAGDLVGGNTVWWNYSTGTTFDVAVTLTISTAVTINGYDSGVGRVVSNVTNKPTFRATTSTFTMLTLNATAMVIRNVNFDCQSQTSVPALVSIGVASLIEYVTVVNAIGTCVSIQSAATVMRRSSVAMGASGTGITVQAAARVEGCYVSVAASSSAVAYSAVSASGITFLDCEAVGGGGGTSIGFSAAINSVEWRNCAAKGFGSDGFKTTNANGCHLINCISSGNGGYGVNGTSFSTTDNSGMHFCAVGGNNGGGVGTNINGAWTQEGTVTLTADPWSGGPTPPTYPLTLGLNTVAGGGAACRGAGYPSYRDIGPYQHADPVAAGGGVIF